MSLLQCNNIACKIPYFYALFIRFLANLNCKTTPNRRAAIAQSVYYRLDSRGVGVRVPMSSFGARGSLVGWGTMLKARRSRVRVPIMSLDSSINLILLVALWPCGRLGLLTEMSAKNLPGGGGVYGWQPYRHLWADYLENVGVSTCHNPMGHHDILQG
jgi:hypothetical protein